MQKIKKQLHQLEVRKHLKLTENATKLKIHFKYIVFVSICSVFLCLGVSSIL